MKAPSPTLLHADSKSVDLWWLDARHPGCDEAELESFLCTKERAKLPTLRHPEVRRHRRFFRARQRQILALYTGDSPQSHRFEEGEHGKPSLAEGHLPYYNLTHSADFGILAITGAGEVGVDLEISTRRTEFLELAERFFAPSEAQALRELPAAAQRNAFFTGWVRKEAWIKALGTGMLTPLDEFQVSLEPLQTSAWMLNTGNTGQMQDWSFLAPECLPHPDAAAAVVVRGQRIALRWRDFKDVRSTFA